MKTIGQRTKIRAKQWAQQPKRRKNKVESINQVVANKVELHKTLNLK